MRWLRWWGRGEKPMVRVVEHLEPWAWRPMDLIQYLDAPLEQIRGIPFNSVPVEETLEPFDPKHHFVMDGAAPDLIHRFTRTNGVPIEFLFRDGRLIQYKDNAKAYR